MSRSQQKDQRISALESQLNALGRAQPRRSDVFNTPIQTAMLQLSDLQNSLTDDNIRYTVSSIMTILSRGNLYSPTPSELSDDTVDPVAESWLIAEKIFADSASRRSRRHRKHTHESPAAADAKASPTGHSPLRVPSTNMGRSSSFRRTRLRAKSIVSKTSLSPFDFRERDLLPLVEEVFNMHGLLERFRIDRQVFRNFIAAVRARYQHNPYHNFRHAFDVLQTVNSLMVLCNATQNFSSAELFSLLLAALCHGAYVLCWPSIPRACRLTRWQKMWTIRASTTATKSTRNPSLRFCTMTR
jgi:hypothetical protein